MLNRITLRKKLIRIGIGLAILMLICFFATVYYINNQRNEIAAMVIRTLNEEYRGDIQFKSISLDNWVGMSSPALIIKDLRITDTTSTNHMRLKAGEISLSLSIDDLLKGLVQVRSATLKNGEIILDNYTSLTSEEVLELPPLIDSLALIKKISNDLLEKETQLTLSNLDVRIRHHVKNKLFQFHINEIRSEIQFESESIATSTSLDLDIETLGFNLEKGHFINGAHTNGSFNSLYDIDQRQLSIRAFDLAIDEQEFRTEAELNFKGVGSFNIVLENEETQFQPTIGLLPVKTQEKFSKIKINEPFYTRTALKGTFMYRGNPLVDVNFRSGGNSALFDGNKTLSNLNFSGRFINRIYDDERADDENKKNQRILLPKLEGEYHNMQFKVSDLVFSSSPDTEDKLSAKVFAEGEPSSLNAFSEEQHWSFKGGSFMLDTEIKGQGMEIGELMAASYGRFSLENTEIINNENQVSLPVKSMIFLLSDNRATLEKLEVPMNQHDHFVLSGEFLNFSKLFNHITPGELHSHFQISSNNLVWHDFVKLFDIAKSSNKVKKPKLALKEVIKDLYNKYDSSFNVSLDKLQFGNVVVSNFVTGFHFQNENSLLLDNTSFELKGGKIDLNGGLNLEHTDQVIITANLNGGADVDILNEIFDEDQLILKGGKFNIASRIYGDLMQMDRILRTSYSSLKVNDVNITYIPLDVHFPVKTLDLTLDRDHAELAELTLELGEEDELTFSGTIQNLSSLLFNNINAEVSSELNVRADRVIWEDYLLLFGEKKPSERKKMEKDPSDLAAAERKLKESLRDIYTSMNPRLAIDIGEFQYQDMTNFSQFHTGMSFKDGKTLLLEETTFLYDKETDVKLVAEIDIADSEKTFVEISLEASGNPEQLNEVLNNDTFLFKDGAFEVTASIEGDIAQVDSLVARSDSRLQIRNSTILHKPSEVIIPFSAFEVEVAENQAELKKFTIDLRSGDQITISGKVLHISDLIFDVPPEKSNASAEMNIYSQKLKFEDFQSLFALAETDATINQVDVEVPQTAIKPTIRDVYNKFRPGLIVQIDEFDLNDFPVTNLKTGFHFVDQNLIYLEKSGFNFYDGSVTLDAHLDISVPGITYFSFGFGTDKIDLEKLLQAFDYFGMDAIKSAERIGGFVSLETEIEGLVNDDKGLLSNSLKGNISFNLEDAQVVGFEPMIKSGSKIFKKERLQDIRFSPIQNTMFLSENTVEIPLMEIQSTAFELFVTGQLGFKDVATNIWIGFPLANLKQRDLKNIPDKRGYIAAGKQVFVEAKSDEKKGMKYVLHLSPKKYYKERDMMNFYRSDRKEDRQLRRKYKRESRKTEREIKKTTSTEGYP